MSSIKSYQSRAKAVHPAPTGMIKRRTTYTSQEETKEAYPPPAVGKAGFCKLQKLMCFIMEMITLFRSGWWQWLWHHPGRHTTCVNWKLGNHGSPTLFPKEAAVWRTNSKALYRSSTLQATSGAVFQELCSSTPPYKRTLFYWHSSCQRLIWDLDINNKCRQLLQPLCSFQMPMFSVPLTLIKCLNCILYFTTQIQHPASLWCPPWQGFSKAILARLWDISYLSLSNCCSEQLLFLHLYFQACWLRMLSAVELR